MSVSRLNRNSRRWLLSCGAHGAALVLLLVAGCIYFTCAAGPLSNQRRRDAAEIGRLRQLQSSASRARATHADIRTALNDLEQRGEAVKQRIPKDANEHEFLSALSQAARKAGLEVVDYRRHGVAQRETHATLSIGLKCRGTHAALCDVLHHLHQVDRIVTIENLTVTSDLATEQQAIEMTVVLLYGLRTRGEEAGDA